MKVISLRCKKCGSELTGPDSDLALSCLSCGAIWYEEWGELSEISVFTPVVEHVPDQIYLPYHLVRFSGNDIYLPGFIRSERTSVSDPSYRFSLKETRHLDFKPFNRIAGLRVRFSETENLLKGYIMASTGKSLEKKELDRLKSVITVMPFIVSGDYLKDMVWGFQMRRTAVRDLHEISEFYSST